MKKNIFIGVLVVALLALASYVLFFPTSKVTSRSLPPFTIAELENGLDCSFDMKSSINVGGSSDTYLKVYGSLVADRFKTTDFTVSLNREINTILLTNPSVNEGTYGYETEYVIVSDADGPIKAVSEKTDDNNYEQYLFLSTDGQFRHVKISHVEWSEMSIGRGVCRAK